MFESSFTHTNLHKVFRKYDASSVREFHSMSSSLSQDDRSYGKEACIHLGQRVERGAL